MPTVWLIRNDVFDEELEAEGFISIGWEHIPHLGSIELSTDSLAPRLRAEEPGASPARLAAHAGTLRRFHDEVSADDVVVAPRMGTNLLRVGIVAGPYYHASDQTDHRHRIPVRWVVNDLRRDRLPESIQNGLRSISTLSRVNRQPEFFIDLAHGSNHVGELMHETESGPNTWLVGASIDGEDQTEAFLTAGIWRLANGLDHRVSDMREGDRIAIKSTYTRKYGVPFENRGLSVSCMMIKARGTVTQVMADLIKVDWDRSFTQREWYFYTFMTAAQRLSPEHRYTPALEAFIFDDADQDIPLFLADPFWGRYSEEQVHSKAVRPSFRVSRPSVGPIYEAMSNWRESLINGTSLFSGEPLNYREATSGLVNDFVEQPLVGGGSFTSKLKDQLAASPASALQLASELLFIYCLPMHQSSMGQLAKSDLIRTATSGREDLVPLPAELEQALITGITPVGTAYHTYRWKVFGYLILLTQTITSLPIEDRRALLSSLEAFREGTSDVDDQSVWSMRFLVEHLLFPDEAVNASSRDDRVAMLAAFDGQGESSDVNATIKKLAPNLRYGNAAEINPYAAPHRFEWTDLGEEARVWGEWAVLLLNDSEEAGHDEPVTEDPSPTTILSLLDTGAARKLSQLISADRHKLGVLIRALESQGLAKVIDELAAAVEWAGDPVEFVEAATAALGAVSSKVPQLDRTLLPLLMSQLGSLYLAPTPSPGETTLAALEALDTLGVAVFREHGVELRRSALAQVAQQLHELDPAATSWHVSTQERFLDWRSGRGTYGPNVDQFEAVATEIPDGPRPGVSMGERAQEEDVPETLDELARSLTFDTDAGRKWLETTRQLLHDRGQIILQGPPGTGKTYVAQRLALFLAGHSSRVKVVQFHPATAYEDFIQGLRPKPDGSGGFEIRPGPLLQLADQARANPGRQHILIVDEINRANLPAVFGELYFLLEYRDTEVQLTSGESFTLPNNLLIIGTMNTADRSIASIDAALRRRFYIHDLRPEEAPLNEVLPRWLRKNETGLEWLTPLLAIANELIGDEDQHIGPSHFLKSDLTEERVRHAWNYTVLPTLREHFYGQSDRLESFDFDALKSRALSRDVAPD